MTDLAICRGLHRAIIALQNGRSKRSRKGTNTSSMGAGPYVGIEVVKVAIRHYHPDNNLILT